MPIGFLPGVRASSGLSNTRLKAAAAGRTGGSDRGPESDSRDPLLKSLLMFLIASYECSARSSLPAHCKQVFVIDGPFNLMDWIAADWIQLIQ